MLTSDTISFELNMRVLKYVFITAISKNPKPPPNTEHPIPACPSSPKEVFS